MNIYDLTIGLIFFSKMITCLREKNKISVSIKIDFTSRTVNYILDYGAIEYSN